MLLTNQRLDKLASARINFTKHKMLNGTCLAEALATKDGQGDSADHQTLQPSDGVALMPCAEVDDLCEEEGAVSGPPVDAHVDLASTIRMPFIS